MSKVISPFLLSLVLLGIAVPDGVFAASHQTSTLAEREGWGVTKTVNSFENLVAKLEEAISAEKMGLVTAASASAGAAGRGVTIPGNRVIGVYRNDFAVRMLEASIAAGIEAPIRFYVTENGDNTATLSYKKPNTSFCTLYERGRQATYGFRAFPV